MQRQAAVAGQFYPGTREQLRTALAELVPQVAKKRRVLGIIAPHAGYVYSGAIAGKVYGQVAMPSSVLIVGPNHHGAGAAAALYPEGEWLTPLGSIAINPRLNALLQQSVPFVEIDSNAHRFEHSLEVQIPFIQHVRPDATMAALCLGHGDFPAVQEIGRGIAAAVRGYGEDVLIVASSDMTHYESADVARRKDELALVRVLAFDPEGLLKICHSEHITMCGVIPAAVMLVASRELGATQAELAAYGNSGDITGDNNQVVGYAAVSVW
jgi:MEMO1 family protein